jgi:hypothetical protein
MAQKITGLGLLNQRRLGSKRGLSATIGLYILRRSSYLIYSLNEGMIVDEYLCKPKLPRRTAC